MVIRGLAPTEQVAPSRVPARARGLAGSLARAAARHPWLGAFLAGLAGWATNIAHPVDEPTDYTVFVHAGDAIWRGDPAAALTDPGVQAGPLTLAALSRLDQLGGLVGQQAVVATLAMALLASACMTAAIRWRQVVLSRELAGAGLLLAWTLAALWGPLTGNWAHPTHAVVPLLWLVCVREAQGGRAARAGIALGLAMALDSWAVFGLCALLVVLPDVRLLLRGIATTLAVTALAWGPFLLLGAGSARMTWTAQPGSLPELLGVAEVGAGYRGVQVLLVLAVGSALVLRLRTCTDLGWLLPVVLVAVRIATDGIYLDYYSFPVRVGLLVGVAVLMARRDRRALPLAAAAWLTSIEWASTPALLAQLPLVAGVVLATVVVLRGAAPIKEPEPGEPVLAQPEAGASTSRATAVSASE